MMLNSGCGVSGMFRIEMHRTDTSGKEIRGSRRVVAPWQKNLITNSGLDNMAAAGFMARCMIGAGNSTPSVSDTQLQSQLAVLSGTVVQGPNSTVEGYNSIVGTYVFGQGVGTGIIAELGVAPASGNITTRALIRDQNGDPTTIVKGPQDVLTVTYQMREYPSLDDSTYTVTNPHTSQDYTVVSRAVGANYNDRLFSWHSDGPIRVGLNSSFPATYPRAANSPLQAATAAPDRTGEQVTGATHSSPPYSSGSYYRDIVITWSEAAANISGGISRVNIGGNPATGIGVAGQPFLMQASFSPPIAKDNTKTLIITLRKSWGRHTP